MKWNGGATRRIRFSVLTVAALATLLLSAMTCDEEPAATAEPAVAAHEPTPEATATPEPTATPKPTVTLQATATAVSTATPKPTATPEPAATRELVEIEIHRNYGNRTPCTRGVAGTWGGRGRAVMWSPAGDEIVFTAGGEVNAVGADGVGLRRLSDPSDASGTTTFDVSPDGSEVIYSTCQWWTDYTTEYRRNKIVRTKTEEYGHALVLASVDGGPVRRLRESGGMEGYPSWSPDGERIAFVSTSGLYSVAADRTDTRRIKTGEIGHHPPQWSPDGKLIAFMNFEASGQRDPAIYVVGPEGRDQHYQRLGDAVSGPAWSSDGQRIAFAKAERDEVGLYTIAVDGTDERRLATIEGWVPHRGQSGPATAWIPTVSWSPDGSKILVLAREADDPEIQIIEADGNGHMTLTVRNPSPEWISDAAWSPDGTRIALSGGFWTGDIALVTIRSDGADPLPLVLVWRRADGRLVGRGGPRDDISAQVSACGAGRAVPDPEANPGLVEDCKTLLEIRNALAGPRDLDWGVAREISEWESVVVSGSPPRVREVAVAGHLLIGEIPPELSRLTELRVLDISYNALMGEIPAELGKLQNLEKLILGGNYLIGEIPPQLGGLANLTELSLENNHLHGEIPTELGRLANLTGLWLLNNRLQADIPPELGRLANLTVLRLEGNRLRGELPAELGQLTELTVLILSGNEFTGDIPAELGGLANLTHLQLANNRLGGEIPTELGQLTELGRLDLSENELAGEIPAELGQLTECWALNLSQNELTGGIPPELGGLANLRDLWLQDNQLTGAIPAELGQLTKLRNLALAGNQFTGCVPERLRRIENNDIGSLGLSDC